MKLIICLFQKKDDELLQKYNEIWQYEFDSKPIYNERYLKVKIKSSNGKISTNLCNNKLSKKCLQYICLVPFSEQGKTIILKCFKRNVNMLLKKKRFIIILLMMQKFLLILMKNLCQKKFRWKKILMKKILIKKVK